MPPWQRLLAAFSDTHGLYTMAMTRFIHDQLAKGILEETLSLGGTVKIDHQLSGEVQRIDVLFIPTWASPPEALGLLGQLAPKVPTIFEPFRKPVNDSQVRACIHKLCSLILQEERNAKRDKKSLRTEELPFLWILTPTASARLLEGFCAKHNPEKWPSGVYELSSSLKAGIIAIHQLPKQQNTLWLRLLGRDKVQQAAMEELRQLDDQDPLQERVLELTYDFLAILEVRQQEQQPDLDPEERELFMQLSGLFQERIKEERQEGIQEGIQEGRREGIQEGKQQNQFENIETILTVRFGTIDQELQSIIEPIAELPSTESFALLMSLSKEELIARFK